MTKTTTTGRIRDGTVPTAVMPIECAKHIRAIIPAFIVIIMSMYQKERSEVDKIKRIGVVYEERCEEENNESEVHTRCQEIFKLYIRAPINSFIHLNRADIVVVFCSYCLYYAKR